MKPKWAAWLRGAGAFACMTVLWGQLEGARANTEEFLEKVCYTSLQNHDPVCHHGGSLHATNDSGYDNCAFCDCPPEWGGVECSLCKSIDSCPPMEGNDGNTQNATQCTWDKIYPTDDELVLGKTLSCQCGGDDPMTQFACKTQPSTTWQVELIPRNSSGTKPVFDLNVTERAGTPSQDHMPSCAGCTKDRYKYAYATVWEGIFNECTWTQDTCLSPMEGDDCIVYTCKNSTVHCPPPYVEKCPGWTVSGCDNPPGESRPYWSHHCQPLTVPATNSGIKVACKNNIVDGAFQCYITQPNSPVSGIGMVCSTGSCIYQNAPHPHKGGQSSVWYWMDHHHETIVLFVIAAVMVWLAILSATTVWLDWKQSVERMERWLRKGPSYGSGTEETSSAGTIDDPGAASFLLDTGDMARPPVAFSWHDIHYFVSPSKRQFKFVLQGISGAAVTDSRAHSERGGSMFAILGPSGAGKTSLLDVLAGRRRGGVSGTVYVNGNKFDLRTKASYISSLVGYVYQDDILPGTSTVFEYLMFHSSLRLPPSVGHKEREWRATHLIDSLGLGRVAHSFIGDQFTRGLSGGEKRRVSIACEMLTSPSILFLDEPTTGLDSTNASKVVDILVDLSTANVNVIFSVHQPRADLFELVDRVLLLSSDGQTAYSGPAAFAERYFGALGYGLRQRGSYFMDYMLDVMIKAPAAEVDQLVEKFHTSDIFTDEKRIIHRMNLSPVELPSPIFRASYIRQLRCLSTRLLRNSIRHPLVISLNLVATFVVALFLGAMFWDTGTNTEGIQSRLGVLFFLILYFAAMSLSSLPIWRAEKLLFMRERAAGAYGTPAYFAAVLAFDLIPLRVIPPIFFGLFSYWMIGLHERCALCIVAFIGLLVMINMVASLMSMMIGAATPSNSVANAVGSLVIMVSLLFGGFLVNKDEIHDHVSWLVSAFANLSYFNFGYEALAVNEFDKAPVDFIFTAPITFKGQKLPPLRIQGDMVLCEFGFNKDQFFVDLMLLACIGGACALATFFLLLAAGRGWCLFGAPSSPRVQQGDVWHKGRLRADTQLQELNRIAGADATTPLLSEDSAEDGSRENGGNVDASAAGSLVVRPWAVRYPSAEGTSTPELLGHNALILSWDNISCRVWTTLRQMERKILSQVSGIAGPPPGDSRTGSSLFAIMGPSGAGKTTLLDILSGRKMDMGVTGDIRLSGHRLSAPKLRKACGYVLQDDVLPGTSTVWEYIMFHAQLRLPRGTEAGKIEERVKQIMDDLGLNKVANSYIGDSMVRGLSGGEKRRVSIACELLTQPGVLILDEPTTGLDSTNATTVVDMLASLASSGTTVIMSIHQPRPNFFHLMQQLMILSGDGQVVYTGTVPQAHDHFTSLGYALDREGMSVVDFALDLVIRLPRGEVDWMVSQFLRSDIAKHNTIWRQTVNADAASGAGNAAIRAINGRAKYATDHKTQLKVLSSRFLNNLYRHPMLLFLNFAAASLMAVVVGAVYWNAGHDTPGIQNRMGSLFFITMYLALMSLSSLPLWDKERLLFVRERASGVYGTTSYFAAVLIFDVIPMRILPPCFFALSYWMIGYRMSPHGVWASLPYIGEFLMILILVNIVASTLSMLIGAAMPTASVANMVGGFIVLVASLLSGGFLSRKQMSSGTAISVVDTLSRLSYMRYGVEALLINEFHGTDGYFFTVSYHCIPMSGKQPKAAVTGDIILETFGFWHSFTDLRWDVLVLVAFMVANLALTYLLFKYRGRPGEPSIGGRLQQVIVKLLPARWRKPRSKRGLLLEERGAIDGHLEEEAGC